MAAHALRTSLNRVGFPARRPLRAALRTTTQAADPWAARSGGKEEEEWPEGRAEEEVLRQAPAQDVQAVPAARDLLVRLTKPRCIDARRVKALASDSPADLFASLRSGPMVRPRPQEKLQ